VDGCGLSMRFSVVLSKFGMSPSFAVIFECTSITIISFGQVQLRPICGRTNTSAAVSFYHWRKNLVNRSSNTWHILARNRDPNPDGSSTATTLLGALKPPDFCSHQALQPSWRVLHSLLLHCWPYSSPCTMSSPLRLCYLQTEYGERSSPQETQGAKR
jgi:hypothetical protein